MTFVRFKPDRFYLLIALLLLWAALYGCAGRQVRTGGEYAVSGDWDKSVQALQKAYNENPDDNALRILLFRSKKNASLAHLAKGEIMLNQGRFEEAIREFQIAVVYDNENTRAESMIEKAGSLKESAYYLKKGEDLLKVGKSSQAREAFQKASSLDPENTKAREALKRIRPRKDRTVYPLSVKNTDPISLKFKNTPILNVFEILTRLTGINFIFDKDVKETDVTLFVSDVSYDQLLDVLLRTNKLAAKMANEKTLIIYPDTEPKNKEYDDLQIRTFYLAHMDVKKAVGMLSKILRSKDIIANEQLNSVVLRGSKEVIEIASRLIEANDRPSSEVMLNVEILEIGRTTLRNLGLDLTPKSISVGLSKSIDNVDTDPNGNPVDWNQDVSPLNSITAAALGKVSNENLLLSLPTATLNFLKQDSDTKTLANPQIRVQNGEKARIHIGERVPLRVNRRVDTTGAITTDFQYEDVGIKLDVEPSINLHDDMTLKIALEVSSVGPNRGSENDPQFSIQTRTAQSVLGVHDGEAVVIGGLISDEERNTIRKIPFLGDLPVVGRLFTNRSNDQGDIRTDIVMAITPIVVRSQEIPGPDVTEIWSGKEQDFSLVEPYESYLEREGQGTDRPPEVEGYSTGEEKKASPQPENRQADPEDGSKTTGSPEKDHADADRDASGRGNWPETLPFSIHLYSFVNQADADKKVRALKEMSLDGFTIPKFVREKGRTYYRVFVGKFKDLDSAGQARDRLRKKHAFRSDIHVVERAWALGG